jgi:predicted tellurium resistance membrane protein TerC
MRASAIIVAVVIMLMAMGPLTDFIQRYPTLKMLGLCRFLARQRRLI